MRNPLDHILPEEKRKTISLDKLRELTNYWLQLDTLTEGEKGALATTLEIILMRCKHYKGFGIPESRRGESPTPYDRRSYY